MKLAALIPARGGSKGLPGKNLAPLGGRPLIGHTLAAALDSGCFSDVYVSTDCPEIAEVARDRGARIPFLRPSELADDQTPMIQVMQHFMAWLDQSLPGHEGLALLQPTSPFRSMHHIREAYALFQGGNADTLVSVVAVPHQFTPSSLMQIKDGFLEPFLPPPAGEPLLRRQDKPQYHARNGPAILMITRAQLQKAELYSGRTLAYEMDPEASLDIDGPRDMAYARFLIQNLP
ncbi:MAG: acylneuraminate cytidylyltransferase family protein [Verrucomicrobiae bacterium]|nr:acylneuraminate cytidylyltransferase family protein [Verrucomicrobiae bacterium]